MHQDLTGEMAWLDPFVDQAIAVFKATMQLEIDVVAPSGRARILVEIVVAGVGTGTLPFEIEVGPPQGVAVAPIEIEVFGEGNAVAPLEIVVFDADDFLPTGGETYCWDAEVILDGVDVSASLLGEIQVEAEENVARVAHFTLRPAVGPIELTDWVGADVQISFVRKDPVTLLVTSKIRMFTGLVDVPEYDAQMRLTTYQCSDNLQQRTEQLDRPTIDSLIQGRYSDLIFDVEEDNWSYAQNQQSTVPKAFDISPQGVFREGTDWASKVTPDYLFTADNIIDESHSVELEDYRGIITTVEIDCDYAYERLRQRDGRWVWNYPGNFCDYTQNNHTIPQKERIESAMNGTTWVLTALNFTDLPPSTLVTTCPVAGFVSAWINTPQGLGPLFALGASGTLTKRFAQSIKEEYRLKLIAPQIATVFGGPVVAKINKSIRSEYDTDKWEDSLDPPESVVSTILRIGTSDDFFEDMIDEQVASRADFDEAILVLIDQGKAMVLDAHRQNMVNFDVALVPTIDVIHTIEIDTETLDARGKVFQVVHTMDIDSGEARTQCTLAVSKSNGDPVTTDPTVVPPIPDTISQMTTTNATIRLDTRYGGQIGGTGTTGAASADKVSDPIDPENEDPPFNGYTGNKSPADAGSIIYSPTFGINMDAIDANDRDEIVAEQPFEYTVAIPNELLLMFA